jgi:hypothetical protein
LTYRLEKRERLEIHERLKIPELGSWEEKIASTLSQVEAFKAIELD